MKTIVECHAMFVQAAQAWKASKLEEVDAHSLRAEYVHESGVLESAKRLVHERVL